MKTIFLLHFYARSGTAKDATIVSPVRDSANLFVPGNFVRLHEKVPLVYVESSILDEPIDGSEPRPREVNLRTSYPAILLMVQRFGWNFTDELERQRVFKADAEDNRTARRK